MRWKRDITLQPRWTEEGEEMMMALVAWAKGEIQKRVNEEDEEDLHERRASQTLKLMSQMKTQ